MQDIDFYDDDASLKSEESGFNLFQALKGQSARDYAVYSENGALELATATDPLVDFSYGVNHMRNMGEREIMREFEKAYLSDPENTVKLLFHIGDVREGKQERRLFDIGLKYLSEHHPAIVLEAMELIPEYTRWDHVVDLIASDNKQISQQALSMVVSQFKEDMRDAKEGKPISLLPKWMPSIQTKKDDQRKIAFKIEKALGISHKEYRKALSETRDKLHVIEKYLSAKEFDKIDLESMTSYQNLKYTGVLMKHSPERYMEYLDRVQSGDAKMNASVVSPPDILFQYRKNSVMQETMNYGFLFPQVPNVRYDAGYEMLWKSIADRIGEDTGTIVVRDGSGSMTAPVNKNFPFGMKTMDVGDAMAIYFAERQQGPLHDKFITFSARPQIVDMSRLDTLADKINLLKKYTEVSNTDIEKTFDLLLDTLKASHADKENVPENVLIISDMEFDQAHSYIPENDSALLFDVIQDKWKEAGYEMPRLIFWNVNSERSLVPTLDNDRGVVLMSGFTSNNIEMVLNGSVDQVMEKQIIDPETGKEEYVTVKTPLTPREQLDVILSKERYDPVGEAFENAMRIERSMTHSRTQDRHNRDEMDMDDER